jgi:hypothetical protein
MRVTIGIALVAALSLPGPTAALAETERSGPFLRVTALEPAPTGIVFRVAWAHHYRPGGAHGPHAVGHLSRVYSVPPKPEPLAAAMSGEEENPAIDSSAQLDAEMMDAIGDSLTLDELDDAPRKEPETAHAEHHHPAEDGEPKAPTSLLFNDRASKWVEWAAAFDATNRLSPGEASLALDLGRHGMVPAPGGASDRGPAHDHATLLYLRAFAGEKLGVAKLKLRLEVYKKEGDKDPVVTTEVFSGPWGIRMADANGTPRFETSAEVTLRYRESTRQILANRAGREYFVSPQGRKRAAGTRQDPWDIVTTFQRTQRIKPGDTVWLLGGVYEAPAHRTLAPADLQMPKESDTAPPPELDLDTGADALLDFVDDMMDSAKEAESKKREKMKFVTRHFFTCELYGTPDQPVIVRAVPGERVVLRGGLKSRGAHAWFWGFELSEPPARANSRRDASHFYCTTIGARLINLHLHGGDRGFRWTDGSTWDAEMYGCIIHDFGYPHTVEERSSHYQPQIGIGLSPLGGIRRLTDNVIFHSYGYNIQLPVWSEGAHSTRIEGNVVFAAGAKQPGWSAANLVVNWHEPIVRLSLLNNVFHQPVDTADNVLSIGYTELMRTQSYELRLHGNVFDGGRRGVHIGTWNSFDAAGNTFRGRRILAAFYPIGDLSDARSWDRNTYIALRESPATGTKEGEPLLNFWGRKPTFKEWQAASRLDANSRFVDAPASLSAPPIVNVRPNLYESGRAHVTVVGWGKRESVDVDLSGVLTKGDAYRVFSVQQMEKPLTEATYGAGPVALVRTGSKRTPDFDAYLVLRDPADDVKDVPARSP